MSDVVPSLYHGTGPDQAESLCTLGWSPGDGQSGGNAGQRRYLYLTTGREDALWFAREKGYDTVVEIRDVPKAWLIVDPEDGAFDTLEEELRGGDHGLPGKVALTRTLSPEHFAVLEPEAVFRP